jgi:hypothetical protein
MMWGAVAIVQGRLFGLLCPLTFTQSDSGAAAVLVNELDASSF